MVADGTPRTLILLRHGKSDYPGGVPDHDRPLAPRGEREAALAGAAILKRVGAVSQVLCSTARRTRETLTASGIVAPIEFTRAIYEASPREILEAIAAVPDDPEVLLVIGHAPGMPGTALVLADEESDPVVIADVQARYPTSAFTVLAVHGTWADLAEDGATLEDLVIPRA